MKALAGLVIGTLVGDVDPVLALQDRTGKGDAESVPLRVDLGSVHLELVDLPPNHSRKVSPPLWWNSMVTSP